jgi:ubiquinone/menaquinone biosynthesis C-methylase UbiE
MAGYRLANMAELRIPRAPQFDPEHARRWHDADAAESYRFRLPYPPDTFELLLRLMVDRPRTLLDLGCGTGEIARPLARSVARVDAVDFAAEMIAVGQRREGGDNPRIRWQVAKAEDAELDAPYSLITGGQSLHWMSWEVLLPRLAAALTPHGMLAVVGPIEPEPPPWAAALKQLIRRYSTAAGYVPFDMITAWQQAGLFRQLGKASTGPIAFEQPLEEYIAAFHATSTLTRAHIDARGFDAELRAAVAPHTPDGMVRLTVRSQVIWGKPLG